MWGRVCARPSEAWTCAPGLGVRARYWLRSASEDLGEQRGSGGAGLAQGRLWVFRALGVVAWRAGGFLDMEALWNRKGASS